MARSMFRTRSAHAGALVALSLTAIASTSTAGEANGGAANSDPITVKSDSTKTDDGTARPPDVVRLHDGTAVRGKLVSSGGDLVSIKVASGETRSYFRSATTYVGSAADDPAEKKAPPPVDAASSPGSSAAASPASSPAPGGANPAFVVHAATAHVNLVGAEPNLTFHMQTDSAGYAVLCTAPCSVETWAGEHRFAVSRPDGKPIEADHALALRGTETLRARLDDSSSTRGWGIALLIAGGIAGLTGISAGPVILQNGYGSTQSQDWGIGLVGGGLAVLAAAIPVGILMIVNGGPHAQIEMVGGAAPSSPLRF